MAEEQSKLSVVIADDHPIVRAGLRQILAADPGIMSPEKPMMAKKLIR